MDLRAYEHAKFDLAELLRSVAATVERNPPGSRSGLQELFSRLAEDRFNLVVVGRFSRGKTSLMNAMLGTERLPVGIVPLTSVITTVAYGSREQAIITYQDTRRPAVHIALDALPEYITQQRNPGNVRQVRTAEVRLNAELLRRGFYFIDTPGLGSPIRANTRTTEQFLPEADAFILVTSYDSPLSDEELQVIHMASSMAKRVFVVLNKQDIVAESEREEAMGYVKQQIGSKVEAQEPDVFSVSAREALEARRAHDDVRLEGSGLAALEATLVQFLLTEKRGEFLLHLCDRVQDAICELLPATQAAPLLETLHRLAERVAHDAPGGAVRAASPAPDAGPPTSAWSLGQCEICAHVGKLCFDFLSHYQYALATDPGAQARHAQRSGFCALHTWQYWGLASPRGVCIAYPALLERLSERFYELATSAHTPQAAAAGVEAGLATRQTCPLCQERARAERQAVDAILQRLRADNSAAFETLSAICVPHHRLLLMAVDDDATCREVLRRQGAILDRLAEDMRRYATKHDAIRRSLASEEEMRAGQVAISIVAGHRNVSVAGTDDALY